MTNKQSYQHKNTEDSVFRDATLCCWMCSSWCWRKSKCLHLHSQVSLDCLTLRMTALQSFKVSEISNPKIQHYIPQDSNIQQHHC